jgi:antirestriction protein ArdC
MSKVNVHEMVTDRIIAELENGRIPWHKPWTGTKDGAYSRATGRAYSLINQMMLQHTGEYLTFNQCQEAGGKIRKGEKSEIIVFYKPFVIKETDADGNTKEKTIPYLQYFRVFHISQCEGIEPKYKPEEVKPFDPIAEAEAVASEYLKRECIQLHNTAPSNQAFYRPATDEITLPQPEQFDSPTEYYSTLFHEMIHSTGHEKRLNRIDKPAAFGSEDYSKEELVAEIGAAGLMNHIGIEVEKTFKNSVAYIQSWIRALKNDKTMIVSASGKAEKAMAFVIG